MSDDEFGPSDLVYYGIAALKGWDEVLDDARSFPDGGAVRVGRLVSSVLLAGDEDREPVAISGALDDEGNGNIAVVYDTFIVVVDAENVKTERASFTVNVHDLGEVERLGVATNHNYFNGTKARPRERGIQVSIEVGGHTFLFPPRGYGQSPLLQDAAAHEAYRLVRDGRASAGWAQPAPR